MAYKLKGMKEAKAKQKELFKKDSDYVVLDPGDKLKVRFLTDAHNTITVLVHWVGGKPYVCIGDESYCPLCESADTGIKRRQLKFYAVVYVYDYDKPQILRLSKTDAEVVESHLDRYGSLTDRDYELACEKKTRGTFEFNSIFVSPLEPSKAEAKVTKKNINLDVALDSMVFSAEELEDVIAEAKKG